MALTALEIKDKRFYVKFRGYDAKEVEEFQDMVYRDYEKLVRENHELETKISALEERLNYFDEMKDSLSQSVLIAQDTAERVKHAANERSETIVRQAEQDAHHLVEEAKAKANEILRHATDNAKKVAVETEELKNKTRVFHQRLKSTIESQLSIIDTPEWDEILRPTAMYIQTSDEAFREVVEKALGESVHHYAEDYNIDLTRQFTPAEIEELQKRIEVANLELGATQAFEGLNEKVQSALKEAEKTHIDQESIDDLVVETPEVADIDAPEGEEQRESVSIL
ncbi:DivIVA domain-containing protein [uncultured Streptococcus sp.]|uniref:DivIVA domain-containing protein n=1 Tax=uncultured Streptococcus sp. TaxID=83427 RepID=UPI0028D11A8E|nr:DivIVA domain-containing protein [uncultured Streptococcus sp.]